MLAHNVFQADKPAEAESTEEKTEKEEEAEEKGAEGDKNDNASTEATGTKHDISTALRPFSYMVPLFETK